MATKRLRIHFRFRPAVLVAAFGLTAPLAACGDGTPTWCGQLESVGDLDSLVAAVASDDGSTGATELDRFAAVAADAPEEIADDMAAINDTFAEVVDIALSGSEADPDELELRREAANQRLAEMPAHVAAVSAWAETECGIRLD
ncbi:MAG: hypothetical protein GY812_09985 [Actinomycetia bacterium]|nr:hypothetical protein [Actinomycetes bacterium]